MDPHQDLVSEETNTCRAIAPSDQVGIPHSGLGSLGDQALPTGPYWLAVFNLKISPSRTRRTSKVNGRILNRRTRKATRL